MGIHTEVSRTRATVAFFGYLILAKLLENSPVVFWIFVVLAFYNLYLIGVNKKE